MEAVKHTKTVRLRTFFLQYLLLLSMGTILLFVVLLGLFTLAFSANVVLPANYAEKEIEAFKDELASGRTLTPDRVPQLVDYAVFSMEGRRLSGNLAPAEAEHAWYLKEQGKNRDAYFYTTARHGEEIWIFRYSLSPQYASSFLRSYLPNPQLLGVLLFILGILLQAALLAARFGRRLTGKMAGLQEATENIRRENLEFTVKPSGILEIDEMLGSLDRMKGALQTSLKRQWELERSRREQISALAHDIKTPLTIIRGNAELLQETAQDDIQREYNGFILKSAEDIEAFVQEVIDLSSMQSGTVRRKAKVPLKDVLAELENQLRALTSGKELLTEVRGEDHLPEWISLDKELFQRGMVNVMANAVDYTPARGSITVEVRSDGASVHFTVTDTGCGFSPADLKEASAQFYMGDRSRSSGNHHGMGLYIAESAAQYHKGTLTLANVTPSGGAKVILSIPVNGDSSGHL